MRFLVLPHALIAQNAIVPVLIPDIRVVAGMGLVSDLLSVAAPLGSETRESRWILKRCSYWGIVNSTRFHPASEPRVFRSRTRLD